MAEMTAAPRSSVRRSHRLAVATTASFGWALVALASAAQAQRLDNPVAVFAALDKVTATIKTLEVPLGKTEPYGSLRVTPRVCYSRPPTDPPKTSTFVEVDEVGLDGKSQKLFSGWMFAESPGLNAVEHPVFDVWLTGCKGGEGAGAPGAAGGQARPGSGEPVDPAPRRRVRR